MSIATMPTQIIGRYQFNVQEYLTIHESGVFPEGTHVELIEGEIYQMSPATPPHVAIIGNLNQMLVQLAAKHAKVFVQSAMHLSDRSMPEPDIQLVRHREDNYHKALPAPSDFLLLIEVSYTSLKYDRETKLPLYAAADIPEVWIVDVAQQVVEQYSEPEEGRYQQMTLHRRGKRIQATQLEVVNVSVDEIFA